VVIWLILVGLSFLIPDGFFIFWGNWVALMGAAVFILIGLVLLVDFAHGFTEMCLEKWENSESGSNLWQYILVGSTFSLYAFTIAITVVMYVYFAGDGCTLNRYVRVILNFTSKTDPTTASSSRSISFSACS
jgi:serine incorporator 1/3